MYTVKDNYSSKNAIPIRDAQMAKNLDFLINEHPDKKFIVWLANGDMSKCDYPDMKGLTMGAQFRAMNPGKSYHIATGTLRMPPERSEKSLEKANKNANSILHLLPSIHKNYFIDADKLVTDLPELKSKQYADGWVFNMRTRKDILNHFDALVIIAKGVEVSYKK